MEATTVSIMVLVLYYSVYVRDKPSCSVYRVTSLAIWKFAETSQINVNII